MKIGEYIRTHKGQIDKLKEYDEESLFVRCENKTYWKSNITKHSPNIIDLIEVGDYVNGWKVRGKTSEKVVVDYYMYSEQLGEGQWLTFYKDNIKSIVTHESFNSIKYEVI